MSFAERYGPWAMIAGASEGTGSAFARRVAAEGLNCLLLARRPGPLASLAEELRGRYRVECVTAAIDLATDDATSRMAEAASDREIGLLICNAGADSIGSVFLDGEISNWESLVMRNVMTVMRACYQFAKPMRARRRGGIILVGSGACYGGLGGIAVYTATKAFDLCFGEGLWAELRPYGVDVLNLIMGRTDTPAFRELMIRKGIPIPTDLAAPEDVARIGLERLPHGPVHNWGLADDEGGYAGSSAAARRQRILSIAALSGNSQPKEKPQ